MPQFVGMQRLKRIIHLRWTEKHYPPQLSIFNEVEIGDQSVRGQVDQETAFGLVCHQPVVEDATHLALVPLDPCPDTSCAARKTTDRRPATTVLGTIREVSACAGGQQGRIGNRLPSLTESFECGDDFLRPFRVGISLGLQETEQGPDARRSPLLAILVPEESADFPVAILEKGDLDIPIAPNGSGLRFPAGTPRRGNRQRASTRWP